VRLGGGTAFVALLAAHAAAADPASERLHREALRKILGENTLHLLAEASDRPATPSRSPPHGPSETPQ
jgi:hypothetical protein